VDAAALAGLAAADVCTLAAACTLPLLEATEAVPPQAARIGAREATAATFRKARRPRLLGSMLDRDSSIGGTSFLN
jgi:hypothetical protein